MRATATLSLLCLLSLVTEAEERLWMEAEINGQPARLIFDSGASKLVLFPAAARRFGLEVTPPPPLTRTDESPGPGEVLGGTTEACTLRLGKTTVRTGFAVVETPPFLRWEEDGVVGWRPLSQNILLIDAGAGIVPRLAQVPEQALTWTKLRVLTNPALHLEIPQPNGRSTSLLVDTGAPNGVALHPRRWLQWRKAQAGRRATLEAYYMPGAGLVVKEQRWASHLAFGPLHLTEVPVMEANPAEMGPDPEHFEASFGLAALKRLDLVVDGIHGLAYLRTKTTPACPFVHNRLGAVFVPRDLAALDLAAVVLEDSPAYGAGIRSGDILLKINELDVTQWRSNPTLLPLSRFWSRPAGIKLDLTVRRGKEEFRFTVALEEILSPDTHSPTPIFTRNDGIRTHD